MKHMNIIKLYQVQNITTLSRTTIYRLIADGKFPKQIKLSERSSGWVEQEVMDYLDKCIEKRAVTKWMIIKKPAKLWRAWLARRNWIITSMTILTKNQSVYWLILPRQIVFCFAIIKKLNTLKLNTMAIRKYIEQIRLNIRAG